MEIILNELRLRNFKGCKEANYKLDSKLTNIFGENESGKTTTFDAFTFLMFGKDSSDRADFCVKTLDKNNNTTKGLSHSVEGVFMIDGSKQTFKRELLENWVKPHGEPKEVFKGHKTNYWVDDVPKKANEYAQMISLLISEDLFKLITNPYYFSNLHWTKRREIVLQVAGEPSNEDVAKGKESFENLLVQLQGKSIDDFKKIIAAKKKLIKEGIADIPARVQEIQMQLPESIDPTEIDKQIKGIEVKIEELNKLSKNEKATNTKYYETYQELSDKLVELKGEKNTLTGSLKGKAQEEKESQLSSIRVKLTKKQGEVDALTQCISNRNSIISELHQEIESLKLKKNNFVAQFKEEQAKVFTSDKSKLVCPTCERPYENSEGIQKEMEDRFNTNKTEALSEINRKGKALKESIEEKSMKLRQFKREKEEIEAKISIYFNELETIKQDLIIHDAEIEIPAEFTSPEIEVINKKIADAEAKLEVHKANKVQPTTDYSIEINNLYSDKESLSSQLKNNEYIEKGNIRIKELTDKQSILSQELADLEGIEYNAECFEKHKIEMMEIDIAKKFLGVRFKMFKELISGGYEPACEILINGVPFDSANHAAQINTGIKIINSLTKHHDIYAPIFVDNAEAVNKVEETNSQIIRLVVIEPAMREEFAKLVDKQNILL